MTKSTSVDTGHRRANQVACARPALGRPWCARCSHQPDRAEFAQVGGDVDAVEDALGGGDL
ncbi:MAG: hypothetical protein R2839_03385 [Thermomicrobiales bacterium]